MRRPHRAPEPERRRDRIARFLRRFGPAAGLIIAALVAVAAAVALVLGGSSVEPPATGAAELVPDNALLYVNVSTDPGRPAVRQALALSRRLPESPLLLANVTTRIGAILGGSASAPVSYSAEVRPWLGKEAALAVLDTSGASAGSLIVLDVRSQAAARRFLAGVGARPDGAYRGVQLLIEPAGTVLAFVRHYLVLGQPASVQAAIDVAAGSARSLAARQGYQRAVAGEPPGRVLDVYASAAGVRRALIPHPGLLGDLGALLDEPRLSAATVSVSAMSRGLRLDVHRSLVPQLFGTPVSPPVQFAPGLAGVLPVGSSLLLDAKGLRSSLPRVLDVAARAGVATNIPPLLSQLGRALRNQGVAVDQILDLFAGETVLAVTPAQARSGHAVVVVTRTSHPAQARAALSSLEAPLLQVFTPTAGSPGLVPEGQDTMVAGVPVRELSLAPGFKLDYAVARGLIVLSTGTGGIAGVFAHSAALSDGSSFQSALGDHPAQVTSLVFFDLSQLLRLGEQAGLIDSTRQATLLPALGMIGTIGLESWRGANDTTTKLQLRTP